MKKLILIISVLVFSTSLFAQERNAQLDKTAKVRAALMAEQFKLDANQQAVCDTLIYNRLVAHRELLKKGLSTEEVKQQMKPVGAAFNNGFYKAFGKEKGVEMLRYYNSVAIKKK